MNPPRTIPMVCTCRASNKRHGATIAVRHGDKWYLACCGRRVYKVVW